MDVLSRSFTLREKILLLILSIFLIGALYYKLVDEPVRSAISEANSESDALTIELSAATAKLASLKTMQQELDSIDQSVNSMPSYNGIKQEMKLLNDIMEPAREYNVTFSDVTRDGDQIRRNFNVSFIADSYDLAQSMLRQISNSPYRCKIDNVTCQSVTRAAEKVNDITIGLVQVTCSATFYETMVGGKEDSGLPEPEVEEDYSLDEAELSY